MRTSVADVKEMEVRGPWTTKSGGELFVQMSLGWEMFEWFIQYDPMELITLPCDIRGLRTYTVQNLPYKGNLGGTEFHRVRKEAIFVTKGAVRWTCEDIGGRSREWILTPKYGVFMPPYLLHTYNVLEEDTDLLVVCNTLYPVGIPEAYDTYPTQEFRRLQEITG